MPSPAQTNDIARLLNRIPPHFSALEQAALLMISDDTPPTLKRLAKREVNRAHAARREAEANRGVRQSGIVTDADPHFVRSVEDLVREAEAEDARMNSPRGRFVTALDAIEQAKPIEGDKLRGIYNRDLADERKPLNVRAVGTAMTILNAIPGQAARDCLDALAELLMNTQRKAA